MSSGTKHKWTFRARFRRHDYTIKAAENAGYKSETFGRICELVTGENFGERFVTRILGRELGLK